MPKFKDPMMQEMYETCRRIQPRRLMGSSAEAYWRGREGIPYAYRRNSVAYAAYAAGRDDRKSQKTG